MATRTTYRKLLNYALANSPWDVAAGVFGVVGVAFVVAKPVLAMVRHKKHEDSFLADPAHAYLAERYPKLVNDVTKP